MRGRREDVWIGSALTYLFMSERRNYLPTGKGVPQSILFEDVGCGVLQG